DFGYIHNIRRNRLTNENVFKLVSIYSNLRLSNSYEKGLKNDSEYQAEINDKILSQDQGKGEQPVAYESRKLSPAELNYPVHEKELLAIVHAIKLWRPYLEGQRFTVITDHASLEYIKSQTNLSRRQARWLEVLQATDFDVKYRPGKTNVVADALSRQIHLTNMTIISSKLADVSFLQQEYQKDNYFSPIWNVLNDKETKDPKQQTRVKYFELKDGKIYLKEGS
ncbi:10597_t:CDS:2, partial [Entrophospora sp. SA101]